jgi:hypothetical protein
MASLEIRREPIPIGETVSMADEIDLMQVGLRTGGVMQKENNNVSVSWGRGRRTLEWRNSLREPNERSLFLWKGIRGGEDMENCGAVMGRDFVAFIRPTNNALIEGEVITKQGIQQISGYERIYNPAFAVAREMALEASRKKKSATKSA